MGKSEKLGTGRCPWCGSTKATYTLSKSGLAVHTCNGCNSQSFSRSGTSDEIFRSHITPEAPPAPPAPAPAPADPAPAPTPAPEPAPPAPAPAGRKSLMSW